MDTNTAAIEIAFPDSAVCRTVDEMGIPIDPMDLLQCESCQ